MRHTKKSGEASGQLPGAIDTPISPRSTAMTPNAMLQRRLVIEPGGLTRGVAGGFDFVIRSGEVKRRQPSSAAVHANMRLSDFLTLSGLPY
jgi:hypothetical protein